MATKQSPQAHGPKGRGTSPWADLTDGGWWRLDRGPDFDIDDPRNVAETARQWGRRNGWKVERRVDGPDTLYLRFTPQSGSYNPDPQ